MPPQKSPSQQRRARIRLQTISGEFVPYDKTATTISGVLRSVPPSFMNHFTVIPVPYIPPSEIACFDGAITLYLKEYRYPEVLQKTESVRLATWKRVALRKIQVGVIPREECVGCHDATVIADIRDISLQYCSSCFNTLKIGPLGNYVYLEN